MQALSAATKRLMACFGKPDAKVEGSVSYLIGKLLKEKIDKGETGVNAGIGFYDYRK